MIDLAKLLANWRFYVALVVVIGGPITCGNILYHLTAR